MTTTTAATINTTTKTLRLQELAFLGLRLNDPKMTWSEYQTAQKLFFAESVGRENMLATLSFAGSPHRVDYFLTDLPTIGSELARSVKGIKVNKWLSR